MCDAIIPSTSMPTMAANLLSEVEVIFDRFELNIDYFLRYLWTLSELGPRRAITALGPPATVSVGVAQVAEKRLCLSSRLRNL